MNRLLATAALLSALVVTATGCGGSAEEEPNDATGDAFSLAKKTTIADGLYGDGTGNFVRVATPLLLGAQSFEWAVGSFTTGSTTANSMKGDTVTGASAHGQGTVEIKAVGANIAFRSITLNGATDYTLAPTAINGFYADPAYPHLQFQIANAVGAVADLVVFDNTAQVYRAPLIFDHATPMTMSYVTLCGTASLQLTGAKGGMIVRFDAPQPTRPQDMSAECNELRTLTVEMRQGARITRYK